MAEARLDYLRNHRKSSVAGIQRSQDPRGGRRSRVGRRSCRALKTITNIALRLRGMKSHWRILREGVEGGRCSTVEALLCDYCSDSVKI